MGYLFRRIQGRTVWIFLIALLVSCAEEEITQEFPDVIPRPVQMELQTGRFQLTRNTEVAISPDTDTVRAIAEKLAALIRSATWFDIPVRAESQPGFHGSIIKLTLIEDSTALPGPEAYTLTVTNNRVDIEALDPHGLFYGVQTLRQLLPPEIDHDDPTLVPRDTEWTIPALHIKDHPRFTYRGLHLDVGRHFFPVAFIKKYIDMIALHKMNRFHWHLTEDQGWRIEIRQYPKLTEIGAWRDSTLVGHYGSGVWDGERYGGYYTREEIREVVQYARERYITVIPEIEMPGHSSAALAAYPELGCVDGKNYRVKTTWGVFEDIYCPSEQTFTFLENVLTEVMELFPSAYIHIGGDEAPKKQWEESKLAQQVIRREGLADEEELQSYFIQRIEQFLNRHGRQIIGWDEILEGGLAPGATVMSWRGMEGGIEAARQGHDVIMTPGSHCYLDHYQANPAKEPLAIGGFTTLEKTYLFEPVPGELDDHEARHILGAQGNVWTEYMHTGKKVEYMAWPRAAALAEVVWSPKKDRDWLGFWKRMQMHFQRLEILEVNAAGHYRGHMPVMTEE